MEDSLEHLSQLCRASNRSITDNDDMWNVLVMAYFKAASQREGQIKIKKKELV